MRTIISFILLCVLVSKAHAQEQSRFSIGFRAGYVNSKLYGSYVDYEKNTAPKSFGNKAIVTNKKSFEAIALVNYNLYKLFYLNTGIGFIQKGGAIENTGNTYPVDVTLTYLNIPVSISIRPISMGKFSILASAGIVNNIELSSKQEFLKGTQPSASSGLPRLPEENHKFIISSMFGGSLRYALSQILELQGDVQFINDLSPFYERDLSGQHYEMKTKGQVWSLGIFYSLKK